MYMYKLFRLFMLVAAGVFAIAVTPHCRANELLSMNFTSDSAVVYPGDEVSLSLGVEASKPLNISMFRLKVKFDSQKFIYKGLFAKANSTDFSSSVVGDRLTVIYLTGEKGMEIPAGKSIAIMELNYKALSGAASGECSFSCEVDGIGNYEAREIPSPGSMQEKVKISAIEETTHKLAHLEAIGCKLSPNFDPDTTKYTVEVPADKSSIEFTASANEENATIKVSRKTLNAAGKSTDISISVLSGDRKIRKVYTVKVNRAASTKGSSAKNGSGGGANDNSNSGNSVDEEYIIGGESANVDTSSKASLVVRDTSQSTIFAVIGFVIFLFFLGGVLLFSKLKQ